MPTQKKEQTKSERQLIEDAMKNFVDVINEVCSTGKCKNLAFSKLEEARLWANAAVEGKSI